jgi:FixJ family two-component response regulator
MVKNQMKQKVFVVDDDAAVRRGVSRLLRSANLEAETFASAREFLKRERFDGPACLVLDVMLPEMDGLNLQQELHTRGLAFPIIFITGQGDIPMSVQAMKAGAADFLPKPFDEASLLAAVRRALEKDEESYRDRSELDGIKERIAGLTPREYEIFTYVITGLLNKQIASELGIAEKTVKVHRGRVTRKMGVVSVAELVRLAEKAGITPPEVKL